MNLAFKFAFPLLMALAGQMTVASAAEVESTCRVGFLLMVPGGSEPDSEGSVARLVVRADALEPHDFSPRLFELPIPGRLETDLGGLRGPLTVDVEAEGWYSAPKRIDPTDICKPDASDVEIALLPTTWIHGRFQAQDMGDANPLKVQFESSPPAQAVKSSEDESLEIARDSSLCDLKAKGFECEVPIGRLDLRFELPGHAPVYFWDRDLTSDAPTDLGLITFQPGASIIGWIDTTNLESAESSVEISAAPQVTGWIENPAQRKRLDTQRSTTEANDRGFFQLSGLRPGVHTLTIEAAGFARTTLEEIDLEGSEEVAIEEAIRLNPPAVVVVYLDPPHDTAGEAWTVELAQRREKSRVLKIHERSRADLSGSWEKKGLDPGTYHLEVIDSNGNRWLRQDVEASSRSSPYQLRLASVAIEGTITRDGEPLETDLVFGTRYRRPNVRVSSDAEGKFSGVLPRSGLWELEFAVEGGDYQGLEPVDVIQPAGKTHARLDLEIPETSFEVTVSRDGEPASARLFVLDVENDRKATGRQVDENGRLEIHGLPPGDYSVVAHGRGESSGVEEFTLEEDRELPAIHLELRAQKKIAGQVIYQGAGVAGARVFALPALSGPLVLGGESTTDPLGRFEIDVTGEAERVDLVVVAGGLGIEIVNVSADSAEPIPVVLSNQKAALLAPGSRPFYAYLHHHASAIPVEKLISLLFSAGATFQRPNYGLALESLAPGEYFLCPGIERTSQCLGGVLTAGSELVLKLHEHSDIFRLAEKHE